MRATLIVVATAVGRINATSNIMTLYRALNKRQAFNPGETTGSGESCVEAFGEGYFECVPASDSTDRLCINPNQGETCCNNLWGCPNSTYCLVQELCCPYSLNSSICATHNNVTLPSNFPVVTPSDTPSGSRTTPSITTAPLSQDYGTSTATSSNPDRTPTPSPEASLTTAAIAGISIGAVVFTIALILAILVYIRGRRRKDNNNNNPPDAADETAEPPAIPVGASGEPNVLEPGQKAELDATAAAKTDRAPWEKQELPGELVMRRHPGSDGHAELQAFELDAGMLVPELDAKEGVGHGGGRPCQDGNAEGSRPVGGG